MKTELYQFFQNKISNEHRKLIGELGEILRSAEQEVIFISPYYVPGKAGIELMRSFAPKPEWNCTRLAQTRDALGETAIRLQRNLHCTPS